MPTISDRKLAALFSAFEAQRRRDPTLKLGQEQVLKLLAEVGDGKGRASDKLLP